MSRRPDVSPFAGVGPDPATSRTPAGSLYTSPEAWAALHLPLLARTWHLVATVDQLPEVGAVLPVRLLPGVLDEPILLVRGEQGIHACANVCTHRGALLVASACTVTALRCPYHGRRFGLDGRMQHAPELHGLPDFPGEDDHLAPVAVGVWGPFVFVSLDPVAPFAELVAPLAARVGWLPMGEFARDPAGERGFEVRASWALWCENYLEGFHVPWVHPALARTLDWRAYRTERAPWGVVQIGVAPAGGEAFDVPAGHPDAGAAVAGWYFHLFATTTFNFYPWGLSVNVVEPTGPTSTRIRYQSWVWRAERRGVGAGGALDEVEHEDDAIVERVQAAIGARGYRRGRYAPGWEDGVHHFHRLWAGVVEPG